MSQTGTSVSQQKVEPVIAEIGMKLEVIVNTRIGRRPRQRVLCETGMAARPRLPIPQWTTRRPVHAARFRLLGAFRDEPRCNPKRWFCKLGRTRFR